MAAGRVIVGTRAPRELVFALHSSADHRIRTLTLSYRRLAQLGLGAVVALLFGFYLLVVQATEAVGYEEPSSAPALDPTYHELAAELRLLLEQTEVLSHRQAQIARLIANEPGHSDYLDDRETPASSLLTLRDRSREGDFLVFRYVERRLLVHLPELEDGARYGDFYRRHFHGLPHRVPLPEKIAQRLSVSSGYGLRRRPYIGYSGGHLEFHRGMDLPAPSGTPIYAAARGLVTMARHGPDGYGNVVMLEHPRGYRTLYAHMKRIAVRRGQYVRAGEIIGEVGSTGNSTGPHLHYEVIRNGEPVNPEHLLGR